jgi:hypothetical protein
MTDLRGLHAIYLQGDEECGVGVYCMADECWDGGRPLIYYERYGTAYQDDPKVAKTESFPELIRLAAAHRHDIHGDPNE